MTDPHFKRFATLQAKAALSGIVLLASRDDLESHTFILTRDAVTVELPSLDAVEVWLELEGTNAV